MNATPQLALLPLPEPDTLNRILTNTIRRDLHKRMAELPAGFYEAYGRNARQDRPTFHAGHGHFMVLTKEWGKWCWEHELHIELDDHYGTVKPLTQHRFNHWANEEACPAVAEMITNEMLIQLIDALALAHEGNRAIPLREGAMVVIRELMT